MVMMVVMPVRVLWWACLHLRPVAGGRVAGTAAGGSQAGQIRTGRTVQPVLVPAVDAFPRQAKVFVSLRVSHRWLLLAAVVPMVLLLVRMGMVVAGVMVLSRFLHRTVPGCQIPMHVMMTSQILHPVADLLRYQ
uniref:Secreted protein n=1 Tax=Anopheles coluzzii TaxID=1518534 RepID=A0A8W7PZJ3_ANOCL